MKEKIITGFEATTKDLLATLCFFTQEEFNTVPFEGSWTPGQVAEHLYKSESNIVGALKGNSEYTERDQYEHIAIIEKIFLNYTTKLKSPEFIIPSDKPKNQDLLVNDLETNRKELKKLMGTLDLDKTFTNFSFPQLGHLTGWECLCFIVCHSKRHIHQMKTIAEKLKQRKAV